MQRRPQAIEDLEAPQPLGDEHLQRRLDGGMSSLTVP